jgi:transposase
MEAYSTKIRELVLGAYDIGKKTKEIARLFKVSCAYARRVKQRLRETGVRGVLQQKHGRDPKIDAIDRQPFFAKESFHERSVNQRTRSGSDSVKRQTLPVRTLER